MMSCMFFDIGYDFDETLRQEYLRELGIFISKEEISYFKEWTKEYKKRYDEFSDWHLIEPWMNSLEKRWKIISLSFEISEIPLIFKGNIKKLHEKEKDISLFVKEFINNRDFTCFNAENFNPNVIKYKRELFAEFREWSCDQEIDYFIHMNIREFYDLLKKLKKD